MPGTHGKEREEAGTQVTVRLVLGRDMHDEKR